MGSRFIKIIVLVLISYGFFSCQSETPQKLFDYGKVENGIYSNEYFGFSVQIPDKWVVQSREQQEGLMEASEKIVTGDDKYMKAVYDAAKVNSAYLLTVFQYEVGTYVEYNPNFMIVAENIKNYPGIKDGAEYLKHAKDLLKQTQLQIDTISNTFEKKEVSGVLFYSMSAKVRLMDKQITQQFNTTVKNNFSLSVIYTYLNEEQEEVLQNTFEGIQFKN